MKNLENKKIAIVCDWIKDMGGAELVLSHLLEIFPNADIFTSVFWQENNPIFKGRNIKTSFIQKIPFLNKSHKLALNLRPYAFESFDLSQYDIVISSTTAEAKGIITKPDTIHFSYCHTPTRYFWSHYFEYLNMMEFGILNPIAKYFMPKLVHKLRIWDFIAAQRVDYFIANSKNTAGRISKYYGKKAEVIHPGIDTNDFYIGEKKDYYLYVGRVIPYKKFDLVVDSFNKNGKKLIICTNTPNKLQKHLENISRENITWILNPKREELLKYYAEAKGFLFPPEEDFGLVPVEAMASGTPTIAFGKGGALETVLEGKTGIFFKKQTVRSLNNAIEEFEKINFDNIAIKNYSKNFDKKYFQEKILNFINKKISQE
ncbi:MAG: glycosyltransferase [Candidatus Gracilibacteria bacterium]|nr:glycosyltransferase [Candidatus Gracilibacteria bacterium]